MLSWFRILVGIQGSYLVLLDGGDIANRRIEMQAEQNNVSGRVLFTEYIEDDLTFLERLNAMDLGVDTSPYNGHTMGIMNVAAALPFLTVQANTMVV